MNKRITLLSALLFCGFLLLTPLTDSLAATEMTIATFHPRTGTADVEGLYHFKELVEKKSNGNIQVKVFFGGTLGGERELVEQLKLGTVHLCLGGWGTRGAYIKDIMPWGFPICFPIKTRFSRPSMEKSEKRSKPPTRKTVLSGTEFISGATGS